MYTGETPISNDEGQRFPCIAYKLSTKVSGC